MGLRHTLPVLLGVTLIFACRRGGRPGSGTAEFWQNTDNMNDWLGVPLSNCVVVDFGKLCTPAQICVEAWAEENACSGDTCGGPCADCQNFAKTSLHIFAYETNSTLNFEYQFTMWVDATSDPGKTMCYKPNDDPLRFVMVCRNDCGKDS